jgi:hypothetical protein
MRQEISCSDFNLCAAQSLDEPSKLFVPQDGAVASFPLLLMALLFVSYFTRPASRRLGSKTAA